MKSKMKDCQKIGVLVAVFLLALPAFSSAEMLSPKEKRVEQEMLCITNRMENRQALDWEDVCSSDEDIENFRRSYSEDKGRDIGNKYAIGENDFYDDGGEENRSDSLHKKFVELEVGFSTGYREDELNWNIAGTLSGTSPNIISELIWSDLRMVEYQAKGKILLDQRFVLDGRASYGQIFNGENQDDDYAGDDRTFIFSRSNNSSDQGYMIDVLGGVGYRFDISSFVLRGYEYKVDRIYLTPLGGYSHHEQNLTMKDGYQTIPASGSFAGLDSSYDTTWDGPWIGLEMEAFFGKMASFLRLEYHWADFYGEANWNLRTDFAHPKSFEHEAVGNGLVFSFGGDYELNSSWSTFLGVDIQSWDTDAGTIRFFLSDGSEHLQRLNEVNWDSYALHAGLKYRF